VKRSLPLANRAVNPEQDQVGRLRIGHDAVDNPGIGVDIATGESKQQRDLHRFIAAYRRTGGKIQRTHVKTQAVADPVWLDKRRPRAWPGLIWIKLSVNSLESNRRAVKPPRPQCSASPCLRSSATLSRACSG